MKIKNDALATSQNVIEIYIYIYIFKWNNENENVLF